MSKRATKLATEYLHAVSQPRRPSVVATRATLEPLAKLLNAKLSVSAGWTPGDLRRRANHRSRKLNWSDTWEGTANHCCFLIRSGRVAGLITAPSSHVLVGEFAMEHELLAVRVPPYANGRFAYVLLPEDADGVADAALLRDALKTAITRRALAIVSGNRDLALD
jgi:hypothetical protein